MQFCAGLNNDVWPDRTERTDVHTPPDFGTTRDNRRRMDAGAVDHVQADIHYRIHGVPFRAVGKLARTYEGRRRPPTQSLLPDVSRPSL
jgi:hypothetical protein